METGILREISPLGEHDFMYVADRHKKEFDYPIHQHEIFELNFIVGCNPTEFREKYQKTEVIV